MTSFSLQRIVFRCGLLFSNVVFSIVAVGQLSVTPSTITFNNVPVGQTAGQSAVLTNTGSSYLIVNQANISGAGFGLNMPSLPLTLAPTKNVAFSVVFSPQTSGSASGSVTLVYSSSSSPGRGHLKKLGYSSANLTVALSGTATSAGQLVPSPSGLTFNSIQVGATQVLSLVVTNSGGASVTVSQAAVTGSAFSLGALNLPITLAPGQAATLNVTFAPLSGGAASGNLAIASNASNATLNVPLSGAGTTPGALTANPSSINFNTVQIGTTGSQFERLSNSGGSSLTITQVGISGAAFSLSGLSLPQALAPGQSVTFTVSFAPTTSGAMSGALTVTSNGSNPSLSITLAGTGSSPGQLISSPTSFNFGTVVVGQSVSQSGTLTASGSGVTISSASSSNSEFMLSGISLPISLSAGQSAPFSVTFAPQASGTASGSISFLSNASNLTLTESLTGSGTAPVQHSVDLSWNGSTSVVVGYNLYRGIQSGGPYVRLNSVVDTTTSYTDSTVQSGQKYFYAATAVDTSGTESAYSNEVAVTVPTP